MGFSIGGGGDIRKSRPNNNTNWDYTLIWLVLNQQIVSSYFSIRTYNYGRFLLSRIEPKTPPWHSKWYHTIRTSVPRLYVPRPVVYPNLVRLQILPQYGLILLEKVCWWCYHLFVWISSYEVNSASTCLRQ